MTQRTRCTPSPRDSGERVARVQRGPGEGQRDANPLYASVAPHPARAHSASLRAFTPVFDGLWTRVNALMGARHPLPATAGRGCGPNSPLALIPCDMTTF